MIRAHARPTYRGHGATMHQAGAVGRFFNIGGSLRVLTHSPSVIGASMQLPSTDTVRPTLPR
jgi:hypothetical protein